MALEVFPYALDLLALRMISNRNLSHFYSARHFVSIISLYLGFYKFFSTNYFYYCQL